ncbi:MAG: hypothetical protein AB7R89_34320, partial [Dehalococcoidia bacterium]
MTGQGSQWLRRRVSRRASLRAGAIGAGGAGLFVLACGSDEDSGSSSTSDETRGLVTATAQAATTKQPTPGGSLSFQISSPPPSLDPYTQTSFINSYMNGLTYSKLWRFKAGVPEVSPGDISMEPDLAQNMGEQPDQMTMVVKLKPAKWQNVAPVNGRNLTSEDIAYAVDR